MLKQKMAIKNKLVKILVIIAYLIIVTPLNILAIPSPSADFFISDNANILDENTKTFVMNKSASLDQMTGAQIVVLTVENMEGKDSSSFAIKTAREWGIGDKEKDNGILILLAIEEGEIRVEVGRGLEGALNDSKVGRIIDNEAMNYFGNGDYNSGILALYKGILREVMVEYNIDKIDDYQPEYVYYNEEQSISIFEIILLIIVIIIIMSSIPRGPSGRRGNRTFMPPNTFGGGFGTPRGGGFSGGGFRGGGGFSGGGGGFSGGGAGRKF